MRSNREKGDLSYEGISNYCMDRYTSHYWWGMHLLHRNYTRLADHGQSGIS